MDCNCNCFGIAASSKRPIKRYNLLVPDIFPRKQPSFSDKLDSSIERKIKKLFEYLEKNVHRGPKVSRRLARKINTELRAERFGYVKLAVFAYVYLLEHMNDPQSNLFAKEVVVEPVDKHKGYFSDIIGLHMYSVVGTLLRHRFAEIRTLGAQLLAQFVQAQGDADYVEQVEAFVPVLCQNTGRKVPGLQQMGNVPASQAATDALNIACLKALQAHLLFASRISYVSHHLEELERCVLDTLNVPESEVLPSEVVPIQSGDTQLTNQGSLPSRASMRRASEELSVTEAQGSATSSGLLPVHETPRSVARQVLQDIGRMTKDAAEGKKVVEYLLKYLDSNHLWTVKGGLVDISIGVIRKVCAEEHQRYLLFSSLVRHVSTEGLGPREKCAVVELAAAEGEALEGALASPALVLALKELPYDLPDEADLAPDRAALRSTILQCMRRLGFHVGDSLHLLEALGGIAGKLPGPSSLSTSVLECLQAAAEAVDAFTGKARALPSRTFPQVLLQEMMAIMTQWEVTQRLLAHRLFITLLPVATDGLRDAQVHGLLSTAWHEVAVHNNPPQLFVSLEQLLCAVIQHCSDTALVNVVRMVVSLRLDAIEGDFGRLDSIGAARCVAVLALYNVLMDRLATQLGAPRLLDLRIQLGDHCPHLRVEAGLQQVEVPGEFAEEHDAPAGRFLETLRKRHSNPAALRRRLADALEGCSALKEPAGETLADALQKPFVGTPISALPPRIKAGGWPGGVSPSSGLNGSSTSLSDSTTRLAKKLKDIYQKMPSHRDLTRAPQARGVKDILAASTAEAERETMEESLNQTRERHYLNVAAECAVVSHSLAGVLEAVDQALHEAEDDPGSSRAGQADKPGRTMRH
ncbi:hypothetical protein WJX72_008813 [[Myrmecia] bisecta]|uniref:Uncharacterized protein n=1 Tax=[Myrmecia] bisecta TaxID=41462 RepID=A0AAW1PPL8_9CHLO